MSLTRDAFNSSSLRLLFFVFCNFVGYILFSLIWLCETKISDFISFFCYSVIYKYFILCWGFLWC